MEQQLVDNEFQQLNAKRMPYTSFIKKSGGGVSPTGASICN
jgi:hypothetical protein